MPRHRLTATTACVRDDIQRAQDCGDVILDRFPERLRARAISLFDCPRRSSASTSFCRGVRSSEAHRRRGALAVGALVPVRRIPRRRGATRGRRAHDAKAEDRCRRTSPLGRPRQHGVVAGALGNETMAPMSMARMDVVAMVGCGDDDVGIAIRLRNSSSRPNPSSFPSSRSRSARSKPLPPATRPARLGWPPR